MATWYGHVMQAACFTTTTRRPNAQKEYCQIRPRTSAGTFICRVMASTHCLPAQMQILPPDALDAAPNPNTPPRYDGKTAVAIRPCLTYHRSWNKY